LAGLKEKKEINEVKGCARAEQYTEKCDINQVLLILHTAKAAGLLLQRPLHSSCVLHDPKEN
jgi:hypothetical protein